MRRTPPQNKGEKGTSPRVTLRLHHIKGKDEKKTTKAAAAAEITPYETNNRAQYNTSMDGKSSDDVYEFKSKEILSNASSGVDASGETGAAALESHESALRQDTSVEQIQKRSFSDINEGVEEGDDENRRKKRKDSESTKESVRNGNATSGRFFTGRNASGGGKCLKNAEAKGVNISGGKCSYTTGNAERNSGPPSGSSPKVSSSSGNNASLSGKGHGSNTEGECDGEELRSGKNSTSNTNSVESSNSSSSWSGGPKVPPLKIVIPQQSSSLEPDQGNRNGKNGNIRHHQALPYVVASSTADCPEKETIQSSSSSGGPSPTESMANLGKSDDKKDSFSTLTLAEEQRLNHHQRVLRSSHRSDRSGNGSVGNGSSNGGTMANITTSNNIPASNSGVSSPAPATGNSSTAVDRCSNNASPMSNAIQNQSPIPGDTAQTVPVTESTPVGSNKPLLASSVTSPLPEEKIVESSELSTQQQQNCILQQPQQQATYQQQPQSQQQLSQLQQQPQQQQQQQQHQQQQQQQQTQQHQQQPLQQQQQQLPTPSPSQQQQPPVDLHPRKRKMKQNKESQLAATPAVSSTCAAETAETSSASSEPPPVEQPIPNGYQMYLDIRKQVDRRRKGLFPVQPKPPQGFKDYLMNRCTYLLAGNEASRKSSIPSASPPPNLQVPMKDLFAMQERDRYRLRVQHIVEKEKLVLAVEQEILRVHGRAARALANQSLPFSVCTILKDEEIYNVISPEQEEKDRNARSRYNGRLFLSWLQDVDDKWEKIKESMLVRHHIEAESLHAVQGMDWEWKMKELGICEFKAKPVIDESHVPMVHVSDDFDLLPA